MIQRSKSSKTSQQDWFHNVKMTYSEDLCWRIVTLLHIYGLDEHFVSDIFGPNVRSIRRWYSLFRTKGIVKENFPPERKSRWPQGVLDDVEKYVNDHPTFYIEELRFFLKQKHPDLTNVSDSTVCRALNFDLLLTRKKLTKAAREATPEEIRNYHQKLQEWYSYPEQLIFIDETSKDGRDVFRKYARSKKGTKAIVKLPFSRGKRVSVLASLDTRGFSAWKSTTGTFTRNKFHHAFAEKVIPQLNPWPLPRSIVIMDNAKIHMFRELQDSIHQTGARLLFLPPYSPELNPIEVCFGQLKRWLQKHANLVFPLYPEQVLEVAMRMCLKNSDKGALGLYASCGYEHGGLRSQFFEGLASNDREE